MNENFDIREERITTAEKEFENALRPPKFDDFSGQNKVVENLHCCIPKSNKCFFILLLYVFAPYMYHTNIIFANKTKLHTYFTNEIVS